MVGRTPQSGRQNLGGNLSSLFDIWIDYSLNLGVLSEDWKESSIREEQSKLSSTSLATVWTEHVNLQVQIHSQMAGWLEAIRQSWVVGRVWEQIPNF